MFICWMEPFVPRSVHYAAFLKTIKQKLDSEYQKFYNLSLELISFLTNKKKNQKKRRKRKNRKKASQKKKKFSKKYKKKPKLKYKKN